MGLDFSHCEVHWAYSGFERVRERLAEQIGLNFQKQVDDGINAKWPKDDIVLLLCQSDFDGDISPEDCKKLAPRIRELVATWEDGPDKAKLLELADGMEYAASLNEPLLFL
jgi:hypothetical protein